MAWCWNCAQTERAYQKQLGVTGCFKSKDKKAPGKSGNRYYKSVGLGFKTPKEAIEGVLFWLWGMAKVVVWLACFYCSR